MKLWEYIVRRLFLLIFVLIGVTMITFILSQVLLDPLTLYLNPERTRELTIPAIITHYHLNDPWPVRYAVFAWNLLHGDWGYSRTSSQPVLEAIGSRFPATMELAVVTVTWTLAVGIPLGIISALKNNKLPDHLTRLIALAGISAPVFWVGLILQLLFSYQFRALGLPSLPRGGEYDVVLLSEHPVPLITGSLILDSVISGNFLVTRDLLAHIVLPTLALGLVGLGVIMRIMRSSLLEVLRQDYIILARSKGLFERVVIYRHALKNALLPTVTVAGLALAGLLGGAALTETVFSWPGIGSLAVRGMGLNDSGLILGFTLTTALIVVVANLVVDILYAYLDPRIKY